MHIGSRCPAPDHFCSADRRAKTHATIPVCSSKGTLMRLQPSTLMAFLLLPTSLSHAQSTDNDASSRAYIQQGEYDWAQSVVTNDVSVIQRICADDFAGVDIDSSLYSKTDTIEGFRSEVSDVVSIHLHAIKIRLYGSAAVAQGDESWGEQGRHSRKVCLDRYLD